MYRSVQLIRPVLMLAANPAATAPFEAAAMYVCATVYGRSRRPASFAAQASGGHRRRVLHDASGAVLADFDSAAAAGRFKATASGEPPTWPMWIERAQAGIRHTFEVHRVRVPQEYAPAILATLGEAWQRGVSVVTDHRPSSPSSARWRLRQDLALAVWRAALLAGPTVRAADGLRIRLPGDIAPVMVRAARLLGVDAEVRYHPSAPIVCITDERHARALLSRLSLVGSAPELSPTGCVPVGAGSG